MEAQRESHIRDVIRCLPPHTHFRKTIYPMFPHFFNNLLFLPANWATCGLHDPRMMGPKHGSDLWPVWPGMQRYIWPDGSEVLKTVKLRSEMAQGLRMKRHLQTRNKPKFYVSRKDKEWEEISPQKESRTEQIIGENKREDETERE